MKPYPLFEKKGEMFFTAPVGTLKLWSPIPSRYSSWGEFLTLTLPILTYIKHKQIFLLNILSVIHFEYEGYRQISFWKFTIFFLLPNYLNACVTINYSNYETSACKSLNIIIIDFSSKIVLLLMNINNPDFEKYVWLL